MISLSNSEAVHLVVLAATHFTTKEIIGVFHNRSNALELKEKTEKNFRLNHLPRTVSIETYPFRD